MVQAGVVSAPASRRGHARALLALGLPLIGSQLAQFALQLTDSVMLGRYDVEVLAGQVLGSSLYLVLFVFGSGAAWAVMPMVARASAAGEPAQVRRATRMGMWLAVLFGFACLPLTFSAEALFRAMGQTPGTAALAGDYLAIAGPALIPGLVFMVLRSTLAALDRAGIILALTLGAVAANAGLNWLFIFGNAGAPEMGVRGAALATLGTSALGMAAIALYAARALPEHRLFVRLWRPDAEALGRVFRLGWPIGVTALAEVGLFSASSVMMGWLGTLPLAAHGIALQIASATFMIHIGLSNAATIRAGRAVGARDAAGLRRGAAVAIAMSLAVVLATVAAFLLVPERLIGPFLSRGDPAAGQIIALGSLFLAAAALFQLADAAQVMAIGLLRGVQDTRVPMIVAGLSYWAVGLPVGYALAFPLGLGGVGIWLGLAAGLALAGVALMARFWRGPAQAV